MVTAYSGLCLAIPQELILNGGFESGSGGVPNSWSSRGSGGWATWKNDNAWGKWGTWYVNAGAASSGQYQEWVQNISVAPGTTCTFSVQSRTEDWGSPTGYIQIDWKNTSGTIISSVQQTLYSGSQNLVWALYSLGPVTVPATAVTADIILHGGYYGTVLFDQVSVLSQGPNTDFNGDYIVNFDDFVLFANLWLTSSTTYDLTGDGFVDFSDLSVFADNWLAITSPPYQGYQLTVNDVTKYQTMDGFGASLTESSAYLIGYYLNANEQQSVLQDLFDPDIGIGLSYLRQPMGASDFRLSNYSYDDIPGSVPADYGLTSFSIARETTYIIPLILEAMEISPDIKIMGSPWSPPIWMKTPRVWEGKSGSTNSTLIDNDSVYQSLANYFVKYIQAYAAWGINIDAVTLQNEPLNATPASPGLVMSAANQIRLIKLVGPAFAANDITTKIISYDHNWDNTSFVTAVYNDAVASSYVDGSAWHDYFGDVSVQSTIHTNFPTKNIYFTESSDGVWNDEGFSEDLIRNGKFVIDVTRNWAKTVIKWNLALDQNNGPKTSGGCDTCYGFITINSATHAVSHRPQYYAIGQASKFVRPGASRIDSTQSPGANIKNVSFQNPDGSIVCFVVSPDSSPHNLRIAWGTKTFIYTLPAASVSTFVWNPGSDIVNVWITTGDQTKLLQKQHIVFFQ